MDFRYQDIWTKDVINFFNRNLDRDLRPIFERYLYHPELPVLQLRFEGGSVNYRWQTQVEDFDMPVKIRTGAGTHTIYPTTERASEGLNGANPVAWQPATDLFYIGVERTQESPPGTEETPPSTSQ